MTMEILDPTHEGASPDFAPAARLPSLGGATIGVISNGKKGTKPFFDALERELIDKYGVANVVRRTKSNYSAPADADIIEEAKQWHALVAGVGD
jgi:hypothetical protein